MIERLLKRLNYVIGLLPLAALFAVMTFVARIEVKDLDLWLHIAMGRFISQHHYIPSVDVLSCTIAGKPWVNHEWLFQVLVYNLFHRWGAEGLLQMQVCVVVATMFILMLLGYNRDRQFPISLFLVLVFLVFQQRFTIRPDLFSLLFFSLYIYILALHIDKRWSAVALVLIQILWSNFHGFFFLGPLLILMGLISEWIKRHIRLPYEWNEIGRLTDEEYSRMKRVFIFVFLSCFVNPNFVRGAIYPISVFFSLSGDNKIFFKYIQELQRPFDMAPIFSTVNLGYYKLLMLLSAVSFVFNRRRIDISALFLWLVFLFFSLSAVRNIVFFAFAAYLVFITNIVYISFPDLIPIKFVAKKFEYITLIFLNIILLFWIYRFYMAISGKRYYDFDKYTWKSEFGGISKYSYPDKGADFLVKNNIKGNFFNDFNSGAYLLGRCYPNIKVFIDGRTEVYGGKFFDLYRRVWERGDAKLFEQFVNRYGLTGVFLNSSRERIPTPILKYFRNNKEWIPVYLNYDATIFLRDIPSNKKIIDKYAIDFDHWKVEKVNIYKLGSNNVAPYRNYYRAYTLYSLGYLDAALAEAFEAIDVAPSYSVPYGLIGKIYTEKGDYKKAFKYFRIAAAFNPSDKNMRLNLANAYYDLGMYKYAIKQYRQIIVRWPDEVRTFFFLAKAYASDEQYRDCVDILRKAHKMAPKDAIDVIKIGDIIFDKKAFKYAEQVYAMAMATGVRTEECHRRLGEVYHRMGDIQRAIQEFRKVLTIHPDDKEIKNKLKALQLQNSVK